MSPIRGADPAGAQPTGTGVEVLQIDHRLGVAPAGAEVLGRWPLRSGGELVACLDVGPTVRMWWPTPPRGRGLRRWYERTVVPALDATLADRLGAGEVLHTTTDLPAERLRALIELLRPKRACGGCTACCSVLEVEELQKPMHTRCRHATPGGGCGIYPNRPPSCRGFACGWLLGAGDEADRPARSGIMVDVAAVTKTLVIIRTWEVTPGALAGVLRDPEQPTRLQLPIVRALETAGMKIMTEVHPCAGTPVGMAPALTPAEQAAVEARGSTVLGHVRMPDGRTLRDALAQMSRAVRTRGEESG